MALSSQVTTICRQYWREDAKRNPTADCCRGHRKSGEQPMTCEECKYWKQYDTYDHLGDCRIGPPVVLADATCPHGWPSIQNAVIAAT